jgi:hypothetical protein
MWRSSEISQDPFDSIPVSFSRVLAKLRCLAYRKCDIWASHCRHVYETCDAFAIRYWWHIWVVSDWICRENDVA